MSLPSASELWARFDYKPLTGELVSKTKPGRGGQRARYLLTSIHTSEGNHRFLVHRAVWKWVTGKDPELTIDHINKVKHDNRFWNLRDVPYETQLRNHSGCKLSVAKVREIKRRLADGEMCKAIAPDYDVHPATISDIKQGRKWREVETG